MGLFKKLFRRKKGADEVAVPTLPTTPSSSNNNYGRSASKPSLKNKDGGAVRQNNQQQQQQQQQLQQPPVRSGGGTPTRSNDGAIPRSASFSRTNVTSRESNSSREREVDAMGGIMSPSGKSKSEHTRVLSPRNHLSANSNGKYQIGGGGGGGGRHDENPLNHSNSTGSPLSPRLSQQQLQQFDLQNNGLSPPNAASGGMGHNMFVMSSDVPRGQLQAMDDMNRSDASSSSFNLSTDAEDSEYETLRRRGVIPRSRSKPNSSSMSGISTGTPYTLEDERLFPGLHDDLTLSTSASGTEPMAALQRLGMSTMPYPQAPPPPMLNHHHHHHQQEPGPLHVYQQPSPPPKTKVVQKPHTFMVNNETDDDLRAWNISPPSTSASSNKEPTSTKSASSQNHNNINNNMFTFDNSASPRNIKSDDGMTPRSAGPVDPPASTTSRSSAATATRNFTSPKSRASSGGSGFSPDPDFATFVDFNSFGNNAFAARNKSKETSPPAWREEKKTPEMAPPPPATTTGRQNMTRDVSDFDRGFAIAVSPRESSTANHSSNNGPSGTGSQYAHSSPGGPDTSLSELLAQAKNKQRGGSRTGRSSTRASSSSVNSAPAITASFLRQHHNLGKYSTGSNPGASSEGTSVSDIIQSLEATNQTRLKNGSRASYGHRSVGDTGAVSTARAVKERLREKRRKEREFGLQNRSEEGSSSENSDNEASESWLFDEVTGALGPRGIAADLESLSGRSNRSKNSQGNKSHRSHRSKSRRSRPGGHRRKSSSGDSVDSRGSRTSRNSRYSHRSTKSFLSQMSEQSRSVANDLLRLEMQLAMVGSGTENRDDVSARVGGGSVSGTSVGGASSRMSRNGRKSSTSHSRSSSGNAQQPVTSISHATRRTKIDVLAPPGKLGIILANKADSKGTVVSGVRTSSVLVDQISPGDRIVAIDGEDVSRMTVSEITTIMSRKADYDRTLTVLTIPKQMEPQQYGHAPSSHQPGMVSPSHASAVRSASFDNSFSQYRR